MWIVNVGHLNCCLVSSRLEQSGAEEQQSSVAAWPQGEGLAAELVPGLLVRLGRPLVVPVGLQLCSPKSTKDSVKACDLPEP